MASPTYHQLTRNSLLTPEAKQEIAAQLDANNPVASLNPEAFLSLLRLIVESRQRVSADRTKTCIELTRGLAFLEGTDNLVFTGEPWTWEGLAGLHAEPLVAFVYRRMVQEVHKLSTPLQALSEPEALQEAGPEAGET